MRSMRSSRCVGTLREALPDVAVQAHLRLANGDISVWADFDGNVYADDPDAVGTVPTHWIAGTYRLGQPIADIEDDLRILLRERAKDWIIE